MARVWFYDEVGAVETDCGTAPRWIWCEPATAACSPRLEHAPTVLARVDSQIGFLKNERNVIAPELLARTAAARSIANGDALAHPAGKPIGRE